MLPKKLVEILMAYVQTLYSGSSGNCTVIRDESTVILLDMGKSCRKTVNALYEVGISVADISAIFVTHEHIDHVQGLAIFLKYYPKPVYSSHLTLEHLKNNQLIPECQTVHLVPDIPVEIGTIKVRGFRTSHDSVDCFGYRFDFTNGKSVAIATDLGCVSEEVLASLTGCSFVGLESNYDKQKLQYGSYPIYLKHRIASNYGHLSNDAAANTIVSLAKTGTTDFMLMHLSQENNSESIAETNCLAMLENHDLAFSNVYIAPRETPSIAVEIK